jgi:anti-anti-sigma factor
MTVKTNFSQDKDVFTITVDGKFDFGVLNDFRHAYSGEHSSAGKYVVDLRGTDSMDSSALGMLLNMKKYLNKSDREIRIINCRPMLKKIFLIARFDKKFDIE